MLILCECGFSKKNKYLLRSHLDFFSPLSSLPKAVKRRINALKQLQVKCAHIEAKFYEEVHDLERKYAALYQPLFDKVRMLLVSFSSVFQIFHQERHPEIPGDH